MEGKFVLQVECGQQHTVCRAVEKKFYKQTHEGEKTLDGFFVQPGGADAYVFGNGSLGQLGIGIRGTSKGRLLPTLVEELFLHYPKGIVDVAAGGNFTVFVTIDGSVYSCGHSEYNQHASGTLDYVDPNYFYTPRKVPILHKGKANDDTYLSNGIVGYDSSAVHAKIVKVSCGFNFTIGIDTDGDVYSWGWNESGVLGRFKIL